MRRVSNWLLGLAFAASAAGGAAASRAETVTIMGGDIYVPVSFVTDGKPDGILPKLLQHAAKRTGDVYVIELMPWRRALDKAEKGEGGIVGLSYTEARSRIFDYSAMMYDNELHIVVLEGSAIDAASLVQLRGKTVGGTLGASYGETIDAAIRDGWFDVERDTSVIARLRKLLAGRFDAALVGNGQIGIAYFVARDDVLSANRERFRVLSPPLTRDPLHLAFAKIMAKRDVLRRFDAAMAEMAGSGELAAIERSFMGSKTQ